MARILITGGTGYIGSHTAVELIQEGHEIIIIDNLSNSKIEVLDGIEKITGVRPVFENFDLTDRDKLNHFFKKYKNIDAVIHFAALKKVEESVREPLKYYKNNIGALLNILEEMKKNSINNLVFSSSCVVYGTPKELPVNEETPIQKHQNPYGATKQLSEYIIQEEAKSNKNLKAILLRYFNPIGAHESALIGELPLGTPDNLIPVITQAAAGVLDQIKIYGKDWNTADGTCIRDYIDIIDLAKAHIVSLNRLLKNNNKESVEIFNLGTGRGVSVLEVIKTFEKATGIKLNYIFAPRRAGDIEKIYTETKRANEILGWRAQKTLEESLKSAWNWEKNYRNTENKSLNNSLNENLNKKDAILLTGGAGFIGFHVANALLKEGKNVVIVDNLNSYYDPKLKINRLKELRRQFKDFKIEVADIADYEKMDEIFKKYRFKKVCHLAAQAGVRYSLINPHAYEITNNLGTLNLLELCRKHNIKDFIYASSSSVYGNNKKLPFSENDRVDTPISLYAATKKSNEKMAHVYHHLFGLNCTGLRFFTVYGPWGRPDMGVFEFIDKVAHNKPINIFNNGEMARDFTFIDDIVNGVVASLEKSFAYEVINLGRGESVVLLDYIREVEKNLGVKAKINLMPMQPGDVKATWADISKAKTLLNYNPKISISEGVKNFVDWYRKYYKT